MTFKMQGNDPNRQRTQRSPDEVKAMMMGGGDESGMAGLVGDAIDGGSYQNGPMVPLVEELDGVTHVEFPHTNLVYGGPARCPTCGRASGCCCNKCEYCDIYGRPKIDQSGYTIGRSES